MCNRRVEKTKESFLLQARSAKPIRIGREVLSAVVHSTTDAGNQKREHRPSAVHPHQMDGVDLTRSGSSLSGSSLC